MDCLQTTQNYNQNPQRSIIKNTVRKIDQLQKEAAIQNSCEGCESSLFSTLYNTKPVTFYLCSGATFSVVLPTDTTVSTTLFRIEDIREDGVILRLLVTGDGGTTCTNATAILDLDCVCGMQCFPPICCEECTRICGA